MRKYDVVVIGAGIQGAGVAQACAAAGYRVLVIEKNAIAAGTSSCSSKLIHGGLRYLESAQFALVRKSLKERAILCRIAPDLVRLKPFYIPIYEQTSRRPWQIRLGLSLYALLGNLHKDNLFKRLSRKNFIKLDKLNKNKLQKVYQYHDGQTNDKKLTQAVMESAKQLGAELSCPATVVSINKAGKEFTVKYKNADGESELKAQIIVNAAGPWVNEIHQRVVSDVDSLAMDLVQGTHIVLNVSAPSGIYYLEAHDHRAVFVMPYVYKGEDKTLIGTTETLFTGKADEVKPLAEECDYLLEVYNTYFPTQKNINVIHQFAGLRVLPKDDGSMFSRPRDTILHWAAPGLLTLYGGKLTAYRSTADLVVKKIKPLLAKRKRIAYTDQLFLK